LFREFSGGGARTEIIELFSRMAEYRAQKL
jgi:hypothetical protein